MDNITLISVIGSAVSIVSFFISLFTSTNKTSLLSNNKDSFNQTLNINSHNRTTNNYDFSTNMNSQPTKTSENFDSFGIFGLIIAIAVIPFYLKYQDTVILYLIIFELACVLINLISLFILSKRVFIDKFYLCVNTLKWFPLFIALLFVYKPLYGSETLNSTKELLKSGKGIANIIQSHGFHDPLFFLLQLIGLAVLVLIASLNIFNNFKQLYKAFRKNESPKSINYKDILWYCFCILLILILVSGVLVNLDIYLTSFSNPK
ncbi:hypothetical protein IAI10_02155 [Clostridium sp. 19966]|uniref:hypothetical protein n=1 Tax=Clostridium sp. 19966 TaxID=2768166 RepID=UPI0028DFA058|nr:hypothetical protein [Clostridium sp. 19966]MDT8715460.1 hypothetical protein [Clostridium sp. 19966]